MERLAYQYEGQVVIGKVDVDQQEQLMRQYDIRTLPTLIYLKNARQVDTQTEKFSADRIQAKIDLLLDGQSPPE